MSDPLSTPASQVVTPRHLRFYNSRSSSLYFGGMQIYSELTTYNEVWATTYTYDPRAVRSIKLTRVICTILKEQAEPATQVRLAHNLHAKLFLCLNGPVVAGFCGSWNLATPTLVELIVRLNKEQLQQAKEFFDFLWDQFPPSKTTEK